MKMQRAAVVGAGAMGSGIAQVLSQAGLEVILKDVKQEFVDRGLSNIKRMYDSRVKKETLSQEQADKFFAKVKGSTTYDDFADVDLVIEAALEEIDLKLEVFAQLGKICRPDTILASNTSALSITEIAAATKNPERVLGLHFFNPAQTMKLVEVIPGVKTSPEVLATAVELCRQWNKTPVKIEECPGFLVNRLLFPYLNESLHVLQEGLASAHDIDAAVVEFGMPMGPFTLLDMTGLDVCQHVNEFLYQEYGPRFAPAKLLSLLTAKKHLGQKTGAGFYTHQPPVAKGEAKKLNPDLQPLLLEAQKQSAPIKKSKPFDAHRVILPMFNEALYALQEKVVDAADVDVAMQQGCGMSKGLLSIARDKGLDWCLNQLESYQEIYGERFRPSWLLRKLVAGKIHDFSEIINAPQAVR